jgi:hypothetical protein
MVTLGFRFSDFGIQSYNKDPKDTTVNLRTQLAAINIKTVYSVYHKPRVG